MVYLLKSIACLLILLLVHRLLLQREAIHRFNRFFLLFSVVVSFLIPAYTIEVTQTLEEGEFVDVSAQQVAEENYYEPITETQVDEAVAVATIEEVQTQFNWEYLLFGLYGLISLIFFFRFVRNIKILVNKIQRNIKINYRGQTLVLLKEESLPFSFLKYIFVAESDLEDGKLTDAVFAHECTHIQEKHSWDNLFIEILLVPFWFHPGLHWAKASIKLNHEFIADEVALRITPLEKYESQLLDMMLSEQKYGLASSLNFSLTKKRFEMMKRKSVSGKSWIKLLVLVPVFGALVYFCSERVAAQAEDTNVVHNITINASGDEKIGLELTFMLKPYGIIIVDNREVNLEEAKALLTEKISVEGRELNINLITDVGTSMGDIGDFQGMLTELDIRRIRHMNSGRKASKAQEDQKAKIYSEIRFLVFADQMHFEHKNYSQLTDIERFMLLSPPAAPLEMAENNTVTPSLEDDGLNEVSKIPHYSFAPGADPYLSYNSFTESYHEELTKLNAGKGTITITPAAIWLVNLSNYDDPVNYFSQKLTEYDNLRNGKPHYINKSAKEQAIIEALFHELTAIIFQFDKEMRSELSSLLGYPYYPLNPPYYPYIKLVKDGEIYYKDYDQLNDDERKLVPPPPPPLPARKTTDSSKNPADHNQTNDPVSDQKNVTASKWPPAVKAARIQHDLQSYIDAHAAYEKLRKQAPHFVKRSKAEQDELTGMFSDLGSMYYQIAFYDKAKVDRPVRPFAPYMKLESNGQVYYKMGRDLTADELSKLPPPPPPATPEKQVEAYKKIYLKYELKRKGIRNDAHRSEAEREMMFQMYNELQEKFLAMDAPERRQVKMVNFPYYRVEEDGKMVFKAINELTPEQRALNNC